MSIIGLNRLRFHRDIDADSEVSIDTKLQDHLQYVVDNGATIISVQQTHCERADPRSTDTYIKWIEVLIITSTEESEA